MSFLINKIIIFYKETHLNISNFLSFALISSITTFFPRKYSKKIAQFRVAWITHISENKLKQEIKLSGYNIKSKMYFLRIQ
ncbi:unnamed protein product [Rhizophagus irregularis]|uniref:Uncharacterized protein n=1 Tax=Rhizophagus irregularis TaxID=588596 RepID=A0A916A0D1_9GLOM|nr:hypothetical protein RIR_jg25904.t1 [Rhizophagus irregularis DAOM 181602=DAOM 197198]CAB4484004.1 unnamed protein product [Rhizophagus irregularis]CAB5394154.1 unnamed protein product [Rhizophagus irregularis]